MAKIQNISEIHPTLGFTEFDILEKYRKSFHASELGSLHSVFPFESIAKEIGLSQSRLGRRNSFSPSSKIALMVLKAYTGFSDRLLVEHLNGNIHYQLFCGIMIDPSCPITNYKIISAVRNEIASRLDIDSLQKILASHWKPYLENLFCEADVVFVKCSVVEYPGQKLQTGKAFTCTDHSAGITVKSVTYRRSEGFELFFCKVTFL